jgi:hypothetical protein
MAPQSYITVSSDSFIGAWYVVAIPGNVNPYSILLINWCVFKLDNYCFKVTDLKIKLI